MTRAARLLDLLQALRARRRPATAAELATELGVSPRTIYRDVATLSAQGAPIAGEAGVGYVLGPGLFLPPLMLDTEETEALLLGLATVRQRGDATLQDAAAQALAKIAAVLPPEARAGLETPVALPGPMWWPMADGGPDLDALRRAIRSERKIRIAYTDASGSASERVVWPFAIDFLHAARILNAWCEARADFRHFRVDRIRSVEILAEPTPKRRAALLREWQARLAADANAADTS
jgi:predicted DNA-binding transcriptional regulator YafY